MCGNRAHKPSNYSRNRWIGLPIKLKIFLDLRNRIPYKFYGKGTLNQPSAHRTCRDPWRGQKLANGSVMDQHRPLWTIILPEQLPPSSPNQSEYSWIGLTNQVNGSWGWVNGEPLAYTNWDSQSYPQATPFNCSAINSTNTRWAWVLPPFLRIIFKFSESSTVVGSSRLSVA